MAGTIDSEKTSKIIQVRSGRKATDNEALGEAIHEATNPETIDEESNALRNEESFSYFNGLYSLVILGYCFMATATHTLIPLHDHFINPEFWWENLILGCIYQLFRIVLTTARDAYCILQIEEIMTLKWHLKLCAVSFTNFVIIYIAQHYIWTVGLNNNPPLPMGDLPGGMLGWYLTIFVIWATFFPTEKKSTPELKKRIKNYMYYLVLWSFIPWQEVFMDSIFVALTTYQYEQGVELQWLMALVIPIFRGFVEWILPKFFNKAVGYKKGWTKVDENEPATFCLDTQIAQAYSLYVAVRLSNADNLAAGCILGIEILINLYQCFRIIRLQHKIGGDEDDEQIMILKAEKKSAIVSLITVEFIEIAIPILYAIGLVLAYYGPNADLMVGIKNEYFGMPTITDIQYNLSLLLLMAAIDAIGLIIVGFLLGWFCKINILEELCNILYKYWIHLAIFMGGDIMHVSRYHFTSTDR